jgi:hypothetical protein
MEVARQVALRLGASEDAAVAVSDRSAVYRDGAFLWVAGDERPEVYRWTASPDGTEYADPRCFRLGKLVDLPEGPHKEVDAEAWSAPGPTRGWSARTVAPAGALTLSKTTIEKWRPICQRSAGTPTGTSSSACRSTARSGSTAGEGALERTEVP